MTGMALLAYGRTDQGRLRETNEDSFCVAPELGLLAVADGLGGRAAGETASRLAIGTVEEHVRTHGQSVASCSLPDLLTEAARVANAAIRQDAAASPDRQGMCTTLTACLVVDSAAHFVHVGDSRAYLVRGGAVRQLTQDHTLAAFRRFQGWADPDDSGASAEQKLLAALGATPWAAVDSFCQDLQPGDLLMLCTDGLANAVPPDELGMAARAPTPLADRCVHLLALANARGGVDNATVVLAEVS